MLQSGCMLDGKNASGLAVCYMEIKQTGRCKTYNYILVHQLTYRRMALEILADLVVRKTHQLPSGSC
jgi:hypothetical protein